MRTLLLLTSSSWLALAAGASGASEAACQRPLNLTLPFSSADTVCMAQWARALMQEAGCVLTIQNGTPRPTARLLKEIETGARDIVLDVTDTPERRSLGWFSLPHSSEQVRLYVRTGEAGRWPLQGLCDAPMQTARVTGPAQGWLGPVWAEVQRGGRRCGRVSLYSHNDSVGAHAVRDGRMDVLVVTDWAVSRMPPETRQALEALPTPVHRNTNHLLLSRRVVREADLLRINAALARSLAQNGPPCGRAPVPPDPSPPPQP